MRLPVRVASTSPKAVVRNVATATATGVSPRSAAVATALVPDTANVRKLSPSAGSVLATRRPTLRWQRRRGARLYNLQIFVLRKPGDRAFKVLSAFPSRNSFRVPAGTLRNGRRYLWRVWPFFGEGRGFAQRPVGVSYFDVERPSLAAVLGRRLLAPRASTLPVARSLTARWRPRGDARIYRVQVIRGDRVVFETMTPRTSARVPGSRLRTPGAYAIVVDAARGTSGSAPQPVAWARRTVTLA